MTSVFARRLAAVITVGLCALTYASSAAAAPATPFGCRASLARVAVNPLPAVEPIVANQGSSPCATTSDGVNSASIPSVLNPALVAGPAAVYTYSSTSQPTTTGPVAPGASALASVRGVTIPTPSGSIVLAGPIEAHASYACTNGKLVAASGSTLDVLYVNGSKISLTAPGAEQTLPLGGGSYLRVNEKIQTSSSLTERLLDVHLVGLADIVVGEAAVTQSGSAPCAGTGTGTGTGPGSTPPAVNACPAGSTLDPAAQVCEIVLPGGTVIVVSRPFAGPTGGTVIALSVARKRYKSPCLSGRGPNYVIVGTNRADRINGTTKPERILGLGGNDRIAGQAGDDCIDGGTGNDRIWGGNGNDRVFGGPGSDRISVQNGDAYVDGGAGNDRIFLGNGTDRVFGGPGNDRISVGRGNDYVNGGTGNDTISTGDGNNTVYGGPGNDRIYVGNGKDHVFGGPGNDRIYAPGETDYVNCGTGNNIAFVNVFAMRYARHHGCQTVRPVRPHVL